MSTIMEEGSLTTMIILMSLTFAINSVTSISVIIQLVSITAEMKET